MTKSAVAGHRTPFLPPDLALALARGGRRALGLMLLGVAMGATAALLTYTSGDPSWNVASPDRPLNMMGPVGAAMADVALQVLGLAAVPAVLAAAIWGLRLLTGEPIQGPRWRPLAVMAALPLLTLALAALLPLGTWPTHAGSGGALGGVLLTWSLHGLANVAPDGTWDLVPSAVAGVLGLWLIVLGVGLRWTHLRDARAGLWTSGHRLAMTVVTPIALVARLAAMARMAAVSLRRHPTSDAPDQGLCPPLPNPVPVARVTSATPTASPAGGRPRRAVVEAPARPSTGRDAQETMRARQGNLFPDQDTPPYGGSLPPLDLLSPPRTTETQRRINEDALANNARLLEGVLGDFGIKGEIVRVRPGPVVTLYELEPAPGIKTARIIGLADDIARAMSAVSVRIAVIPGKSVIGIELPNARRQGVNLRELLATEGFTKGDLTLTLALGRDIGGGPVFADLARMPHMLIAGTTGSGKSVAVNAMIQSLLYRLPPDRCRLILIDPKMLELSAYDGIPHLLTPVVTDPGKAVVALKWAVKEMENRYRAMSQMGVRNIKGFNQKVEKALAEGGTVTRTVQTGFDPETGEPVYEQQAMDLRPLPNLVIVVDEMADLMLVAGKEVEAAIQRLAQMARAAGIHLIMATQRPSVDVITGTIKANFPTRISFQVTSKIDSRTVLGEQGAEQLLGQGDMLYMAAGGRITRVHGPFVSDEEVERICDHLRRHGAPDYVDAVTLEDEDADAEGNEGAAAGAGAGRDPLFDRAVALVARERKASTSFVQRHLQIGYNRAARIIERMEKEGMVGRANHVGKREVLLPEEAA